MGYRDILKEHLIDEEGLRYTPYLDTVGVQTIGVGHNMVANPLPNSMQNELLTNGKLTIQMIMELLEKDIDKAELGTRKLFENFNDFSENRKVALVDLVFNMGVGGLSKFFGTLAAIRSGQWSTAGECLRNSKWYKQVGTRGPKVVRLIVEG